MLDHLSQVKLARRQKPRTVEGAGARPPWCKSTALRHFLYRRKILKYPEQFSPLNAK